MSCGYCLAMNNFKVSIISYTICLIIFKIVIQYLKKISLAYFCMISVYQCMLFNNTKFNIVLKVVNS